MMNLWELRQIIKDAPDSPWRKVLSWSDYITIKVMLTVILVAIMWFVVGMLGILKEWIGG